MAEQVKGFAEHYAGFKRHLKLAVAAFAVVSIFGVGFAFSLPDIYKAQAFILIEDPDIPEEIIRSTVTTYTSRQLTNLNEKILTVSNLIRIIEQYDLYAEARRSEPVELIAAKMRNSIGLGIESRDSVSPQGLPQTRVVGFSVSFEDEDPQVTKLVVDELVTLYLEENIKARASQTAETSDFLKGEVGRLEVEIAELETKLARFKEENADKLPSMSAVNLNMMNRIDTDLMNIQRSLSSIEESRLAIKAQLATVEPNAPVRLADGTFALSPADQLKSLQTQLSLYESKYSEDHPDVIATRRDIDSIKRRYGIEVSTQEVEKRIANVRKELAIAREKYSPEHPDVVALNNQLDSLQAERRDIEQKQLDAEITPDNPAFIQLETTLATLDAEEKALREEEAVLRRRLDDYERRLAQTPQIEKELAALSRTLSSTSNRYWVLRDKQFAAEMGETLETQSKGEEMTLIEPARVPLRPYKPNRPAIISLAFLFALVAGVGITQLADALDKSIRDSAGIISVTNVPPLAEIPYIHSDDELAHALKLRKMTIASVPVALALLVVIVHFLVIPLDVVFYAIAARLGF